MFGVPKSCLAFQYRVWRSKIVFGVPKSCLAFQNRVWRSKIVFGVPISCLAFQNRVWRSKIVFGVPISCLAFQNRVWRSKIVFGVPISCLSDYKVFTFTQGWKFFHLWMNDNFDLTVTFFIRIESFQINKKVKRGFTYVNCQCGITVSSSTHIIINTISQGKQLYFERNATIYIIHH